MRLLLALTALASSALWSAPAAAQVEPFRHYPYCLFSGGKNGVERCSYTNFQQCLYDRQAEGGVCYENPWYFAAVRDGRYHRPQRY